MTQEILNNSRSDTNSNKSDVLPVLLNIRSKASIIHIGSLDSFDVTEGGKSAAKNILEYLEHGKDRSLRSAIDIYDRIIPTENFGGEYTALQWICKLLLSQKEIRDETLSHPFVESWFDLLAKDDFANLKDYLKRKYHFIENKINDPENLVKLRFLEDFILFNNPDRERWDKTCENFKSLDLREGDKIIDFGCGPGYFTFKFADIVGEDGYVYGIETNDSHIKYVKDYIKKNNIKNVNIFEFQPDGLGIDEPVKADMIYMCSLYHVLYASLTDNDREIMTENIKSHLKEDGRFIVVDNDLVEGGELPYHGPYISREMVISQLWHLGFDLIKQYQFTPQRYVLEFNVAKEPREISSSVPMPATFVDEKSANVIKVTSPSSLVRYGVTGTSQGYTPSGKNAARLLYTALETKDKAMIESALEMYEELIPKERIGDEYTAFEWFCKYLLAYKERRAQMLSDKFDAEYFHHFADEDFALLKKYLRIKYELDEHNPEKTSVTFDQINEWSELIVFNNPNRERWEKTSEMFDYLDIKKGESIADIGCGFGSFSFRFSQLTGKEGKIYSTEINKGALKYVEDINAKYGLNIKTIQAALNNSYLPPNSVDTIFMCSMYHAVYIASIEFVKDQFIDSLKKALKKNGRLVIVDNAITPPSVIPYFGNGIAKELVISQLRHYGFHLVGSKQFIPQRYMLVFQQE